MSVSGRPKRIARRAAKLLLARSAPAETEKERAAVEALRAAFAALPDEVAGGLPQTEEAWRRYELRLRDRVLREGPRRFLTWDVIEETMFVGNAPFLRHELSFLRSLPAWRERWRAVIRESAIGAPPRYLFAPYSSGNLVHHAYHVASFEEATGTRVDGFDRVVEFGGGYGSMCRVFHRLGFAGRYTMFDLPAFSSLQAYYLRALGIPLIEAGARPDAPGAVVDSDIERVGAALEQGPSGRSLFVATWSISETPQGLRDRVLGQVRDADAYLIAIQDVYQEMDNTAYFDAWRAQHPDVRWVSIPMAHLPPNSYLFGVRSGQA
jgi:hypothetical protein